MSLTALVLAPLMYLLGVLLIFAGAAAYLVSRLKLLLVNAFLQRPLDLMSGSDALMMFANAPYFIRSETSLVINAAMELKGRIDVAKFQQRLLTHVLDVRDPVTKRRFNPRLRQRPARRFGYFVWEEDEHFDIQRHVRISDHSYTDEASLIRLIERISHTPLPEGRTMWEVLVIPKTVSPGADDECAILLRAHHSLIDGVSLVALIGALWDKSSRTVEELLKTLRINPTTLLAKYHPMWRHLANPNHKWTVSTTADVMKAVLDIGLAAPWLVVQMIFQTQDRNSLYGPTLCGRKLMTLSELVEINLLKDICSGFNCCISDILNLCFVRAFQRCNKRASDLAGISSDDHITLVMPMYFFKARPGWTQNGFSPVLLRCPLQGESLQQHFRVVADVANDVKRSPLPFLSFAIFQGLGNHLPLALAKKCIVSNFAVTALVSNIVGFPKDVALLGLPVTNMFFLPVTYGNHLGISCAMLSYKGYVRLGITVDRAVAPDDCFAQRLADDWIDEVQILHNFVKNMDLKAVYLNPML